MLLCQRHRRALCEALEARQLRYSTSPRVTAEMLKSGTQEPLAAAIMAIYVNAASVGVRNNYDVHGAPGSCPICNVNRMCEERGSDLSAEGWIALAADDQARIAREREQPHG